MTTFTELNAPVRIEAMQVSLENLGEVAEWTGGEVDDGHVSGIPGSVSVLIYMKAYPGQWVGRRADGLFFVRDDGYFREHYEA